MYIIIIFFNIFKNVIIFSYHTSMSYILGYYSNDAGFITIFLLSLYHNFFSKIGKQPKK